MAFPGRYILINPPTPEALQTRLAGSGKLDEAAIKATIESIPSEAEANKISNKVIINDDLDSAAKSLSSFIYGKDEAAQENGAADEVKEEETKGEGEEKEPSAEGMQVDPPAAES